MKFKKFVFTVLLIFLFGVLFADENVHVFFPKATSKTILPVDSELGQCVQPDDSDVHQLVKNALSEPYGFEWTEKYLHPDFRKNLALVYSDLFSEILPCSSFLFSKSKQNADSSVSISVRLLQTQQIIGFAVTDGFISAVQIIDKD